jgi:hypothetical protein
MVLARIVPHTPGYEARDPHVVQNAKEDKTRRQQKTVPKFATSTELEPLETAHDLRARLKKQFPGLTDQELDYFM